MPTALEIYIDLFYLDTILIALLACLAFYRYMKRTISIKLLGWLMLISFAANCTAFFILKGVHRNIPSTAYDFCLVLLAGYLYDIQTKGKHRKFIISCTVFFFLFGCFNLIYLQPLTITSYNKLLSAMIILCYALLFFYHLMKDLPERQVHHLPMFWFNSGFLIYHAGTIFLFAFTSYLINVLKDNLMYYMIFHNILNVVQHLIFIIGFRYDLKRIDRSESVNFNRNFA